MNDDIPKNLNINNDIKAKSISLEKWNEEMNKIKVNREDMNKLVLNYLIIEGYKDPVEKFIKETGIVANYDAELLDKRMKIRKMIIKGEIDEAINEINDINPEILEANPSIYFELQKQKLIEIIKKNDIENALLFAQNKLFPIAQNNESLLGELEKIMVLLVYDDINKSPYKDLGTEEHLKKLASIMNLEILSCQMQSTEHLIWLSEEKVKKRFSQIIELNADSSDFYKQIRENYQKLSSAELNGEKRINIETGKTISAYQQVKKVEKVLKDSKNSFNYFCSSLITQITQVNKKVKKMENDLTNLTELNKFYSLRSNYEYFLYCLFDLKDKDRVENFTSSLNILIDSVNAYLTSYFKNKIPGITSKLVRINYPEIELENDVKKVNDIKFKNLLENILKKVQSLKDLEFILENARNQYYDISSKHVHNRKITRMKVIKISNKEEELRYTFITILTMFCESEQASINKRD